MYHVNRIFIWETDSRINVVSHVVRPKKDRLGWTHDDEHHYYPQASVLVLLDTFGMRFKPSRKRRTNKEWMLKPSYLRRIARLHRKQLAIIETVR